MVFAFVHLRKLRHLMYYGTSIHFSYIHHFAIFCIENSRNEVFRQRS